MNVALFNELRLRTDALFSSLTRADGDGCSRVIVARIGARLFRLLRKLRGVSSPALPSDLPRLAQVAPWAPVSAADESRSAHYTISWQSFCRRRAQRSRSPDLPKEATA
jgi:hypothetical protein